MCPTGAGESGLAGVGELDLRTTRKRSIHRMRLARATGLRTPAMDLPNTLLDAER